jgi:hypothetical protein
MIWLSSGWCTINLNYIGWTFTIRRNCQNETSLPCLITSIIYDYSSDIYQIVTVKTTTWLWPWDYSTIGIKWNPRSIIHSWWYLRYWHRIKYIRRTAVYWIFNKFRKFCWTWRCCKIIWLSSGWCSSYRYYICWTFTIRRNSQNEICLPCLIPSSSYYGTNDIYRIVTIKTTVLLWPYDNSSIGIKWNPRSIIHTWWYLRYWHRI